MLAEQWIHDLKKECERKLNRPLKQEEESFLEWLGGQHCQQRLETSSS